MAMVEYREQGGIAYITLNRPEKLNALSDDMYVALCNALYQLNDDENARVGIVSGNGRAFCSGADVKQRQLRPREELGRFGGPASRQGNIREPIFRSSHAKPLIAAVHGYAYGAGLKIALYCDLIVASKGTKFQITEVPRGIDGTPFWMLLTQRGAGAFASEVALTGRVWLAEEGAANGVVNRLAQPGEHVQVAESLAGEILKNPPLGRRRTRGESIRNAPEESAPVGRFPRECARFCREAGPGISRSLGSWKTNGHAPALRAWRSPGYWAPPLPRTSSRCMARR
ncbi:MAG: enoyl-CoA hydratase/isomerase family protein [Betaproteobacteria bacterium]|nr:enoyl-CoA hydratase/isomerase family protein [Betaproteobacteria bacterium]